MKEKIPIVIRCDNSHDLEMIPSDLSDFNVYDGLYRYVNLNHVPATYLNDLKLYASADEKGKKGSLTIKEKFEGNEKVELVLEIIDPEGKVVATSSTSISPQTDYIELGEVVS
ncbi:hypothetical protein R9C00_23160 [Flammeovirgaceae bacterium SG7u.111]|nr:hypothetical protein [Flammeovirgaceae bacterium SG7u.132]WPO34605.1 hypothetical protein R9C00_23160 [Flammeovirgaceae bacterium SG7u.111]